MKTTQKTMNEQECYKLLGYVRPGNPCTEMTIESLTAAIIRLIEANLTDSATNIKEFKPIVLGSACLILKHENGDLLLLIVESDGYLNVCEDAQLVFRVLSTEALLREVAHPSVVAELERLRAELVAARLAEKEDLERAEYERLKRKFNDA